MSGEHCRFPRQRLTECSNKCSLCSAAYVDADDIVLIGHGSWRRGKVSGLGDISSCHRTCYVKRYVDKQRVSASSKHKEEPQ